ncbi:MAG: DUF3943 domain-containing protein [Tannerellaceae bacterium]|nr:DUF3943 domain-containing protein [Tannerellaceae bacterium]
MRIVKMTGMLVLLSVSVMAQHFPKMDTRNCITDTALVIPHTPWRAVGEIIGLNMGVWAFNRHITKGDFAYINFKTIKQNFKTGPVWDVDKFSTNLVAHPYHGSLYYNAARSNGMNIWQSIPFTLGGSLMWEFFMENEPPSINNMIATTFGGVELGEITYRLSDLFIDNRSFGSERVGREILVGVISPIRALNRIVTGEAWKRTPYKGRTFASVPINFVVNVGPRFLAEQEETRDGSVSLHVALRLDYGDPYDDEFYSPYEWFQLRAGFDFFNSQSLISQVNAIGALWGKTVWQKDTRNLTLGIFQHFAYYDSQLKNEYDEKVSPYRIAEAASVGGGLIYNKKPFPGEKVDIYADLYVNAVALGAGLSDYFSSTNVIITSVADIV